MDGSWGSFHFVTFRDVATTRLYEALTHKTPLFTGASLIIERGREHQRSSPLRPAVILPGLESDWHRAITRDEARTERRLEPERPVLPRIHAFAEEYHDLGVDNVHDARQHSAQ